MKKNARTLSALLVTGGLLAGQLTGAIPTALKAIDKALNPYAQSNAYQTDTNGRAVAVDASGRRTLVGFSAPHAAAVPAVWNADLNHDRISDPFAKRLPKLGAHRVHVTVMGTVPTARLVASLSTFPGVEITGKLPAIDAVSLRLPANQVRALAALPGVKQVLPVHRLHAPGLNGEQVQRKEKAVTAQASSPAIKKAHTNIPAINGDGIGVAVLDSGVDSRHKELVGRVKYGATFVSMATSGCAATKEGLAVDVTGHGTHVAGIIAGTNVGIAPKATIYSVRIFDCMGTGSSADLEMGLQWVADNYLKVSPNIKIVNLSVGFNGLSDGKDSTSLMVDKLSKLGIAVIVAAGNNGLDGAGSLDTPAGAASAITVGAVAGVNAGGLYSAYFSSKGPGRTVGAVQKPTLSAPGVDIESLAANTDDLTSNSISVTEHASMSGTSMAAPYVAGLAALALQRMGTANTMQANYTTLVTKLKTKVTDVAQTGWDPTFGYGVVDPATFIDFDATLNYAATNPVVKSAVGAYDEETDTQTFVFQHAAGTPIAITAEPEPWLPTDSVNAWTKVTAADWQMVTTGYNSIRIRDIRLFNNKGQEVPLDESCYYANENGQSVRSCGRNSIAFSRTTGDVIENSVPAGQYTAMVSFQRFGAPTNVAVSISGLTASSTVENISGLLDVSIDTQYISPEGVGILNVALSAKARGETEVKLVSNTDALVINPASVTLQPGESQDVEVTVNPDSSAAAARISGEVTASADGRLLGFVTAGLDIEVPREPGTQRAIDFAATRTSATSTCICSGSLATPYGPGTSVLFGPDGDSIYATTPQALTPDATPGVWQLYVRHLADDTIQLLMPDAVASGDMFLYDISSDGYTLLVATDAPLLPEDDDQSSDLYVVDALTGDPIQLVTVGSDGQQIDVSEGAGWTGDSAAQSWAAAFSNDGSKVVFKSTAAFDANTDVPFDEESQLATDDLYLRNLADPNTVRLSGETVPATAIGGMYATAFDATDNFVTFSRLVPAEGNGEGPVPGRTVSIDGLEYFVTLEYVDVSGEAGSTVLVDGRTINYETETPTTGFAIDEFTTVASDEQGRFFFWGVSDIGGADERTSLLQIDPWGGWVQENPLPEPFYFQVLSAATSGGEDTAFGVELVVQVNYGVDGSGQLMPGIYIYRTDTNQMMPLTGEDGTVAAPGKSAQVRNGWVGLFTDQALSVLDSNGEDDPYVLAVRVPDSALAVDQSADIAAAPGQEITLTGSDLENVWSVTLLGNATDPYDDSVVESLIPSVDPETEITSLTFTLLEDGSQFGRIRIWDGLNYAWSAGEITLGSAPEVTGFAPEFGTPGTTVTINGTGFDELSTVEFSCFGAADCWIAADSTYLNPDTGDLEVSVPADAATGPIRVSNGYGPANSASDFTVKPVKPTVADWPAYAVAGKTVVLEGENLSYVISTGAKLGTTALAAPIFAIVDGRKTLTLTMPKASVSGALKLCISATACVTAPAATKTVGFDSKQTMSVGAIVGGTITIAGYGLLGVTDVMFGDVAGTIQGGSTETQLKVKVPAGARSSSVSVLVGETNLDGLKFTLIEKPTIKSAAGPNSSNKTNVNVDDTITVIGTSFAFATGVTFGGGRTPVAFSVQSDTQLTFKVPAGATGGKAEVTNAAGTAASTETFTIGALPKIASVADAKVGGSAGGLEGSTVSVTGSNFTRDAKVFIGTTAAVTTFVNATSLKFVVPAPPASGQLNGQVRVTNSAGSSSEQIAFTVKIPTELIYSGPTFIEAGKTVALTARLVSRSTGESKGLTMVTSVTMKTGTSTATAKSDGKTDASFQVSTLASQLGTFKVDFSVADSPQFSGGSVSATIAAAAATNLVYTGDTSVNQGSKLNLSAKLTRKSNNAAVAKQSVKFTYGGKTFDATTDASGVAKVSVEAATAGSQTVSVSFANAGTWLSASASGTVNVIPATMITYTGKQQTRKNTQVTLKAKLTLADGKTAVKGATIQFLIAGKSVGSAVTDSTGVASLSWKAGSKVATSTLTVSFDGNAQCAASTLNVAGGFKTTA